MTAQAKTSLGPLVCVVTNCCLEATSIVGVAHGLSTTPDIMAVHKYVWAANVTLGTPVSVYADSTTLYFSNAKGDKAVLVDGWAQVVHTLVR
ncbi:MAG: hypothetical protein M0R22_00250 [Dehalococcoidia bacterium]|nr:hypothetical protein [Dehalococcoidia bacterium]